MFSWDKNCTYLKLGSLDCSISSSLKYVLMILGVSVIDGTFIHLFGPLSILLPLQSNFVVDVLPDPCEVVHVPHLDLDTLFLFILSSPYLLKDVSRFQFTERVFLEGTDDETRPVTFMKIPKWFGFTHSVVRVTAPVTLRLFICSLKHILLVPDLISVKNSFSQRLNVFSKQIVRTKFS